MSFIIAATAAETYTIGMICGWFIAQTGAKPAFVRIVLNATMLARIAVS